MYDENVTWYNQLLFSIQDDKYGTDGHLRVSISNNTKDFFNFSNLFFSIAITTNNHNKSVLLNIQNAFDLLNSIRPIIQQKDLNKIYDSNLDSNSQYQIYKRYNKNSELIFEFVLNKHTNEKLVRISIRSNESDFTKILIEYNNFIVFAFRLKWFVDNYENTMLTFNSLFLQRFLLDTNEKIITAIKNLPSMVGSVKVENFDISNKELDLNIENETINEFESFLENNSSKIKIPELNVLETKNEIIQTFDRSIILKSHKNISSIEKMLISSESAKNPLQSILNTFKSINPDIDFLPGIDEGSLKSIMYLSKLTCSMIIKNVIENASSVPSSIRILKYKIDKEISKDNIDFAIELLAILGYLQIARKRLESKTDDPTTNKSFIYLIFRSYLDPFIFSILEKVDKETIKTSVISRFKYFEKNLFFNEYNQLITTYNQNIVTEKDIDGFVTSILGTIGNGFFIDKIHDQFYKSSNCRLPFNNIFTEEQITNEIIPLEIYEKTNKSIENYKSFDELNDSVKELFLKMKKEQPNKKKTEIVNHSNLFRLISQYRNQVPENTRTEFLSYIEKLDSDCDLKNFPYPLETFGDDIVKILYLWKPSEDEKLKTNYKYFFEKFENEILTKELILVKSNMIQESKNETNDCDWDSAMNLV